MKKLVVLGNGGYSRTVQDIAEQCGYKIIAILDDNDPKQPLSSFASYLDVQNVEFIPAFGNNEFRLSWCEKITSLGGTLANIIHPNAYVSEKNIIETGVVILPGAIVNTGVVISRGCIINIGVLVDHDVVLEAGVHLAPGAIVKGENRIKSCTKVESGEVVQARQWPL